MTNQDPQVAVEMLPARHGDAFLIRIAAGRTTTNILVDAGPQSTYRNVIRPRLLELAAAGETLRAVIVTHIDADHIEGAIEFLDDNGPNSAPSVIRVEDVWHNSYRHLCWVGTAPSHDDVARVQREAPPRGHADRSDISARQGSTLAALLRRHGYPWNLAFDGAAAAIDDGARRILLGPGVWLTLLSPTRRALAALARLWRRELVAIGAPRDVVDADAFEEAFERVIERDSNLLEDLPDTATEISARALSGPPPVSEFREDLSRTNASSIAFILDAGNKRALFLGDSHPSSIVTSLRSTSATPLDFVALKVSHHGSKRNTSPELCSALRVEHALISTDGSKHGHPDIEGLLWLISTQPGVTLHFNYPSATAESIATPELLEKYGHRVLVYSPNSTCLVRL